MTNEEILKAKFHMYSTEQWEDIKLRFPYSEMPAALNLARADEREGNKWISVEEVPPAKEVKNYWIAALYNDGEYRVAEAVYMLFDKTEWLFCDKNGWRFIFQPSHYQPRNAPTPPKQ